MAPGALLVVKRLKSVVIKHLSRRLQQTNTQNKFIACEKLFPDVRLFVNREARKAVVVKETQKPHKTRYYMKQLINNNQHIKDIMTNALLSVQNEADNAGAATQLETKWQDLIELDRTEKRARREEREKMANAESN